MESARQPARNANTGKSARSRWLSSVELTDRTTKKALDVAGATSFSGIGMTVQRVNLSPDRDISFNWHGLVHYVALHDLTHVEAETFTDDKPVDRRNDLRGRLTFVPAGCRVWGWSRPAKQAQSFTALYFNPGQLESELSQKLAQLPERSHVYFTDTALGYTLQKLHLALSSSTSPDPMYLESLCLLGTLELCLLGRQNLTAAIQPAGFLAKHIERRITEYITANLQHDISLDELAGLAGLSRFHFSRAFKRTTQCAPYQYLLRRRVEQATLLLKQTSMSVAEIAAAAGFKDSTQFVRTFRRFEGFTPGQLRRSR